MGLITRRILPPGAGDHGTLTGLGDNDHTQYAPKASPTFTGVISFPAGEVAAPSIYFGTNTDTGIYSTGSGDRIDFATGGILRLTIADAFYPKLTWYAPDGGEGNPPYSFDNSSTSGFYRVGANIIGFSTAGTLRLSIDASGDVNLTGTLKVDNVQVITNRVIDARSDDATEAAFDALYPLTAGLIDSLRDAMITHGLIAAA